MLKMLYGVNGLAHCCDGDRLAGTEKTSKNVRGVLDFDQKRVAGFPSDCTWPAKPLWRAVASLGRSCMRRVWGLEWTHERCIGGEAPLHIRMVFVMYRSMWRSARFQSCGLGLLFLGGVWIGYASEGPNYPYSVEEEIKSLVASGAQESEDPVFLTRLAGLYMDAGDDLYTEKRLRLRAYEEGARMAEKALTIQDDDARAHYLYAGNLGNAASLKGVMASALTVRTLKTHVRRALELEPDYAPALHMMGMLLEELPALFGGDSKEALRYLQRAIEVDPTYTHARLNLAKVYLKNENARAAKKELEAILEEKHPRSPYAWTKKHKPEAMKLLQGM